MEVMQKKTGTRTEIRNDRREVQVRVRNAQDENYELVMLDEFPVLFTNGRLDRKSIPEGLFCYDIRHDDECQGIACEVKPFVLVNHWGTILSKSEIPLENVAAPRGSKTGTQGLKGSRERSIIPKKLCEHIVDICEDAFRKEETVGR